jgi:hypothetical protein
MTTTYRADVMDADSGGNGSYRFEAASGLFGMPARDIVDTFMRSLTHYRETPAPLTYELDSAIKKPEKQIVMATGSITRERGSIPFLLMISPIEQGER